MIRLLTVLTVLITHTGFLWVKALSYFEWQTESLDSIRTGDKKETRQNSNNKTPQDQNTLRRNKSGLNNAKEHISTCPHLKLAHSI